MADIIKLDMTDIWASGGDKIAPAPSKIAQGWLVEVVPRQTWNWFENRQDQNIAYLLQKGFPEWDVTTEYVASKSWVNRSGIIYKSILTGTNQDPTTATTYWVKAFPESSAALEALRVLTPAADRLPYFTNGTTAALATFTSFARTLLDDTTAATARTTLGAQASHANLTALSGAGVVGAVNVLPYFDSTTTMAGTTLSAFGRSLIDDADATAARTTLGLGTAAVADLTGSLTDTTAGRVTKVGDWGLGGDSIAVADANTIVTNGWFRAASTAANIPTAANYMILHMSYTTSEAQLAISTTTNDLWIRIAPSGVWGAWEKQASDADVTSALAALGLGTTAAPQITDLDGVTVTSFNRFANTALNIPLTGASGIVLTQAYATTYRTQMVVTMQVSDASLYNRLFTRTYNSGVWGTWKEYVNTDVLATTLASYALNGVNTDITSLSNVTLSGTTLIGTSIRTNASDSTTVPTSGGTLITPAVRVSGLASDNKNIVAVQGYSNTTGNFGSTMLGTRSAGAMGVHGALATGKSVFTLLGAASDGTKYNPIGRIDYYTTEAQTASAAGGEIRVLTTPIGTIVPTLAATFHSNGNLTVVGAVAAASLSLTTALPVASGGTGATTATGARGSLQAVGYDAVTGSATLPAGTTAQRSASPVDGMIRYNSDTASFEGYQGGAWGGVADANLTYVGGANRMINSNCGIVQRSSATWGPGTAGYSGPDRYKAANGTASGAFSQASGTITDGGIAKYAVLQTVTTVVGALTTGNYWNGIAQFIEGFNSYDLVGKDITISFLFNTNVTGTYALSIRDGGTSNSFVNTFTAVANTPKRIVLTTTLPVGASIPKTNGVGLTVNIGALNTGTFQGSSANTWLAGNYLTVAGVTNWGATVGNFISLTDLKLEQGTVATPVEHVSVGDGLIACQRYYEKVSGTNAGRNYTYNYYKVQKRAVPTLSLASGSVNGADWDTGTDGVMSFRLPAGVVGSGVSDWSFHADCEL